MTFHNKALLGFGPAPKNYTKSYLTIYTSIMEMHSVPCVYIADLFRGAESLIPVFEKPLCYEIFYLGDSKYCTIDEVLDFVDEHPEDELYKLVRSRAQQLPFGLVRF
jgi:hypothetical protein